MNQIDQKLTDFKIELAKEWKMLQTHKWRRPKWIKLPLSLADDPQWFKLSDEARSTFISLLLIAGENPGSDLPPREILFRRLQTLGNVFQAAKFDRIISELNQCGFLTKTSPEFQSYRATELQKDKKEENLIQPIDSSLRSPKQNKQEVVRESEVNRGLMGDKFTLLKHRLRLNDLSARLEAARPRVPADSEFG
jgi:hypothetical protein